MFVLFIFYVRIFNFTFIIPIFSTSVNMLHEAIIYSFIGFITGFIFYTINKISNKNIYKPISYWFIILTLMNIIIMSVYTKQLLIMSMSIFYLPSTILAAIVYLLINKQDDINDK